MSDEDIKCSFCNKAGGATECMVKGPRDVAICADCVEMCRDLTGNSRILNKEKRKVIKVSFK